MLKIRLFYQTAKYNDYFFIFPIEILFIYETFLKFTHKKKIAID